MKCNSIKLSWTMLGLESLWKCWSLPVQTLPEGLQTKHFPDGFLPFSSWVYQGSVYFNGVLVLFWRGVGTKFAKSVKQIFTNSKGVILMIVHTGGGVDIKWNIHEIQQGQLNKMTKVPSGSYIELLSSHMPILMQTLYIITLYHL